MHRLLPLALLSFAACANRGLPADVSIESTFPNQPASASLPRQLRVVTFNVHGEPATAIGPALARDRALRDADVILLQEVHRVERSGAPACSEACELGKLFGYHALFAPGHAIPEGSHGVAILSRAPITSAQVLELPYFNVHFNSGRRVALMATLEVAGAPVTVYAVHLDNRLGVKDRRTQMTPVLAHAAAQPTPVIIGGDFNTSPFTWISHVIPVLTTTQDNRFEALVRSYGFDTPLSRSGATHRYIGMKLDAIYTRGFETLSFATSNADEVSDHLAVWARLRLRSAASRGPVASAR